MVRQAVEDDIPSILKLLIQVDMVHHNGRPDLFKGPATKYQAEELERIFEDGNTPVFVCVDEKGKVLGHAFCVHQQYLENSVMTDIRTLYIDDICVDEAYRKCGVGKELYEYVLSYARKEGYYNVTLNVWNCNPAAIRFYEKMGMSPYKIGMEYIL